MYREAAYNQTTYVRTMRCGLLATANSLKWQNNVVRVANVPLLSGVEHSLMFIRQWPSARRFSFFLHCPVS